MAHMPSEGALKGLRILIVDDDLDTLGTLGALLNAAGAETLAVDTAQRALAALESFRPNVVVTDLAMPVVSGVALVRNLRRSAYSNIPVLGVTAYGERYRDVLPEAGFDRILQKPLEPGALVDAIRDLTGNRPERPTD